MKRVLLIGLAAFYFLGPRATPVQAGSCPGGWYYWCQGECLEQRGVGVWDVCYSTNCENPPCFTACMCDVEGGPDECSDYGELSCNVCC